MTKFGAEFARDFKMIVNDEANVGAFCDRQNFFCHLKNFFRRKTFCAQLNQVAAAVAKLLLDDFRLKSMQISCVHEGIKFAVRGLFHSRKLSSKVLKE